MAALKSMRYFHLLFALCLTGFYAIAFQVLMIREFLSTFSGNELSIGIILANWIILEALGSYLAGKFSKRNSRPDLLFAILQLLLAIFSPLVIYLIRISNIFMATIMGEIMPIPSLFILSLILLFPVAVTNGAQFSTGSRILANIKLDSRTIIGRLYVYDALGSLAGGLVITYLGLKFLDAFQCAFLLAALNSLSALYLLYKSEADTKVMFCRKLVLTLNFLLFSLFNVFLFSGISSDIQRKSLAQQWPGYTVVSHMNSIYGNVTLLERDEEFALLNNGSPILSLPTADIAEIEELSHLPLLFHAQPHSVLLIGGGLNGMITELLKHPVSLIDYVELDPLLTTTVLDHLPPAGFTYLQDNRLTMYQNDGRNFLVSTKKRYDIILLNLPDPATLEINRFYTLEFFMLCKSRLNPAGILFFRLPGGSSYINASLLQLNQTILASVDKTFTFSRIFPFEYTMIIASDDYRLQTVDEDSIASRLCTRKIQTYSISEGYLFYRFDSLRTGMFNRERQLIQPAGINRDFNPRAVYYNMKYWNDRQAPVFAKVFTFWAELKHHYYLISLCILLGLMVFVSFRKTAFRPLAAGSVMLTTGFAGMGLTLIMILSFQAMLGYVYFWIGMIISGFMLGLAAGGKSSTAWLLPKDNPKLFLKISDAAIILYFILLSGFFFALEQKNISYEIHAFVPFAVLAITALGGFLMGTQFPLAANLFRFPDMRIAETAGSIYALDLLGAWAAGIIVGLVMIPLHGIFNTIMLFILIKAGSFLILLIVRQGNHD